MKILIVEDTPMNLELATDLLEAAGHMVLAATSAEAGFEIAKRVQPDLILMDISLPGIDGLVATHLLKANDATRSIPVIALTAHAMQGDQQLAREAGCLAYLTKPFDTRNFVYFIETLLATSKTQPTP